MLALLWWVGTVVVGWYCCGGLALLWWVGNVVVGWHCCGGSSVGEVNTSNASPKYLQPEKGAYW